MTLLRDLVICNSSGVPEGTADGQYLRWNATASAWELVNVIPVADVDLTGNVSIGGLLSVAQRISSPKGVTTGGRSVNAGVFMWYPMPTLPDWTLGVFLLYRQYVPDSELGLWLFRCTPGDIFMEEVTQMSNTEVRTQANVIEFRHTGPTGTMWYWAAQLIIWGA